jgi:hypothetical protein
MVAGSFLDPAKNEHHRSAKTSNTATNVFFLENAARCPADNLATSQRRPIDYTPEPGT